MSTSKPLVIDLSGKNERKKKSRRSKNLKQMERFEVAGSRAASMVAAALVRGVETYEECRDESAEKPAGVFIDMPLNVAEAGATALAASAKAPIEILRAVPRERIRKAVRRAVRRIVEN